MLTLHCSTRFTEEKEYILKVLLSDFLGLSYNVIFEQGTEDFLFTLENGASLKIKEADIWKGVDYLTADSIPSQVSFTTNSFIKENNIPVLFGNDTLSHEPAKIICGIDIFASSFFMLSRWEEYVVQERDEHNRFPAKAALAYKNDFLHRPIVNEYVEMLWHMLSHLGINQERTKREYSITLTHDVDDPFYWKENGVLQITKEILRAIKNRDMRRAKSRIQSKLNLAKDPFFTFNRVMDISESHGLQSHFFFMAGGDTKYDNRFSLDDPRIEKLVNEIDNRGHIIGFHPSYDAYNDGAKFKKELDWLQSKTTQSIKTGREHYLRFATPDTWQVWEKNDMNWDSTMSYAEKVGFRCGTCYSFPVFDILEKKQLNLLEKPLTAMEATLYTYMGLSFDEICRELLTLKETVKKYGGDFVFLWHNSFFHKKDYGNRMVQYEKIIQIIK